MKKVISLMLVCVLLVSTLAGCSQLALLGTWDAEGSEITFEFGGKGSMVFYYSWGTKEVDMEWEVDGDELIMRVTDGDENFTVRQKFRISGKSLEFLDDDGDVTNSFVK